MGDLFEHTGSIVTGETNTADEHLAVGDRPTHLDDSIFMRRIESLNIMAGLSMNLYSFAGSYKTYDLISRNGVTALGEVMEKHVFRTGNKDSTE